MVRQKRIYYSNAVYHITFRGNNRQNVFENKEDKIAFLKSLSKFKNRFQFKLYGFVIMSNHAHLVIQTNHYQPISKIMHALLLSYSFSFRKRHHYIGHVWQGRFKSNVIEDDRYILECLEYIHNNPVRAKLTERSELYPWSSYSYYYNLKNTEFDGIIEIDRFGDISLTRN